MRASPKSPSTLKIGYIPTLDGWRAFAILAVLMNHDRVHRLGWLSTAWFHINGRRGVDLFFALSGVLICTRLLEEEQITGGIDLKTFYLRRLFRIQPAAWVYLATISLLMFSGAIGRAFHGVLFSFLLVRNYLPLHSNWFPPLDYFRPDDWYTSHFWSLSVEEHFYLFLPGFLMVFRKHRAAILICIVGLLEIWKEFLLTHPKFEFGWAPVNHTDVAVNGILLASAAAVLLTRPKIRAWCQRWVRPSVTLPLTVALLLADSYYPGPLTMLGVLLVFPVLIVSTVLHPDSFTGKLLEVAPVRFLGRISYSIYLWQSLFFTNIMPVPAPHSAFLWHIQNSWLRYVAVLLVGLMSYYLIERPMVKIGHRLAKSVVPGRDEPDVFVDATRPPFIGQPVPPI